MKNYQFKWLLLSIILSLASINTAGAYTYTPVGAGQQAAQTQQTMQSQQPAIQSHQMMHGGSTYQGQVYTPFSGEMPSSQSSPARISGPRRGYNPETGEWTPDAPDIETAGDYGQSGESPIGEPWVMALFALAFAGAIAIRQYKRKTIKSIHMKNSTSKFIATLALLCTIGVGQMWASWTVSKTIYFDFTAVSTGRVNYSSGSSGVITTANGAGTVISFTFTGQSFDGNCMLFSTEFANWEVVKWSDPGDNNCVKVNADGRSFSWTTYGGGGGGGTLTEMTNEDVIEVLDEGKVMVYLGIGKDWSGGTSTNMYLNNGNSTTHLREVTTSQGDKDNEPYIWWKEVTDALSIGSSGDYYLSNSGSWPGQSITASLIAGAVYFMNTAWNDCSGSYSSNIFYITSPSASIPTTAQSVTEGNSISVTTTLTKGYRDLPKSAVATTMNLKFFAKDSSGKFWEVGNNTSLSSRTSQSTTLNGVAELSPGTYTIYAALYDSRGVYIKAANTFTLTVNVQTYTLSYNANGKDGGGAAPSDVNSPYNRNSTVTVMGNVNNMSKTGYHFAGWNTKSDYSGTDYAPGATFNITADTILYAKWVKTIYVYDNLSWNSMKLYTWDSNNKKYNGAWSGESLSQIGTSKWYQVDIVSGPDKLILNNGSAQTEDITIAGNSPSITDGHSYETYDDSGTKKLREKKLTVSFNMKSHGSAVSSQSKYYNELVTEPSPAPSVTGYTFGGWYKETGCTNAWNFATDKVTADKELFAKWTANEYTASNNIKESDGTTNKGTYKVTYDATSITYTTTPTKTGYSVEGLYYETSLTNKIVDSDRTLRASTSYTTSESKWNQTSAPTLYVKWTANKYDVTLRANTGTGADQVVQATYAAAMPTALKGGGGAVTVHTKTGYTLQGYWDTDAATGGTQYYTYTGSPKALGSAITWNKTSATNYLYARWQANDYTITLTQSGETGYGSAGDDASVTAKFNADMPSLGAMPTGTTGYKFQGYYSGHNGTGSKVVNADGSWNNVTDTISAGKYVRANDLTLYAYFEKAQITNIVFSPTTAAGETRVVATPTISPTPEGTTYICWKLFNNAECTHETEGYTFSNAAGDAILYPSSNSNAVSFVTPAFTGSYYVQAILRAGNDCEESTKLDSVVYQYLVASDHTVKVKYMCDGVEIAPLTEVVVPAAGYKGIKALSGNDVFGYQFSSWSLGDGLTNECVDATTCGAAGKDSIYISAVYNGTLTANYSKKNMIFFKDNLGWTNPENEDAHVYVHLKTSNDWNNPRGTGNKYNYYSRNNEMNRVPGTSDIFYYDYGETTITQYIVFTKYSYDDYESFTSGDTNNPAQCAYPTNPSPVGGSTGNGGYGFDAATPMFVPLTKEQYAGQEWNSSLAIYFNRGYWVNYIGEETGYYLDLYDTDGSSLIKSVKFTSEDKLMSMSVTLDLEAAKDYYFKLRRGSSITYGNSGYMKSNNSGTAIGWEFDPAVDNKCKIKTTAAGDYTFLLSYSANNEGAHALRIGVTYPSSTGDYRIVYKDRAEWSQGSAHSASWYHPSRVITQRANTEDMVSFYISKAVGASASLTLQQVSTIDPSTGAISWEDTELDLSDILEDIVESGVYNFKITQDENKAVSVTYEGAYDGNYYIRTDNAGSTKWSDYVALDHQMTYSEYAQNSGYTHYYMHYCTRGSNVKFCIANDYSPCISDTLIQDVTRDFDQNMNEEGFLSNDGNANPDYDRYSANIRFMWNQNTNKISRAYLSSSLSGNLLTLTNNGANEGDVTDENGVNKSGVNITFKDDQNWIYEAIVKVKPNAKVRLKVYARYSNASATASKDQYLIGSYNSGTYDESSSELLLTGTGDVLQTIRILYDFKTNRLVKAWMPTAEIEGAQTIDADLMIVREHQQSAQNILLTELDKGGGVTEDGSLTTDKKIYAVMRFNRWILSNRANPNDKTDTHAGDDYADHHPLLPVGQWLPTYERSLYYISFPFDVKVSEIFGFGVYGTHYAIQRYDGAGRAKNGYWVDSDPNWKWVPPTGTLNAYEGYVLSLSMSNMDAGNTSVWANKSSEIELYFPSSTTGKITIETTNVTIDSLDSKTYKCTIERDKRNIKDSYWRCIGVPSYADYSGNLTDSNGLVINWQKDNISLPFIYEINWQDKSLTPFVGTNFPFKAMHSYLVQYGGEIHWTNVVNKPSAIVAREKSADAEQIFQLELSQNNEYCDRTFVRMTDNEDVTNNFDFNQDLSKETNSGRANIWTLTADSVSAAGNSMPTCEQTTIIPVGVKIIADGEYTFSMPEGTNGTGVYLIDNIAGTRTNLALTDYSVNLTAGTYDGRFSLEISPIAQTPTDIKQTSSDSKDGVRKVMVDGVLYILRDGQVFDARGQRVE